MNVIHKNIKDAIILPAKDGTCPICAVDHDPRLPHNKDSLFYQMSFYQKNDRFPTWKDAMEHCSEDVKKQFTDALKEHGVEVE